MKIYQTQPRPFNPARGILTTHPIVSHAPLPQTYSRQGKKSSSSITIHIFQPHFPHLHCTPITHAATRFRNRFGSRSNTRYRRLPRPLSSLFSDQDRRTWGSGSKECTASSGGVWRAVGELERGRVDVVSGWADMMLAR